MSRQRRAIGLGVGALPLIVAAVFAVVGQGNAPSSSADRQTAKKTVIYAPWAGLQTRNAFTLRLVAVGQPPSETVRLTNDSGESVALVVPQACGADPDATGYTGLTAAPSLTSEPVSVPATQSAETSPVSAPAAQAGSTVPETSEPDSPDLLAGETPWCFIVRDLEPGVLGSGDLQGSTATIELTIGRSVPYFPIVAGVTVVCLILGYLAMWWFPKLGRGALQERLDNALDQNDHRDDPSLKVVDLREKADQWQRHGVPLEERTKLVEDLVEFGGERMRTARESLNAAVQAASLPEDFKVVKEGKSELARTDLRVGDLLDEQRKQVMPLPLDAMSAQVVAVGNIYATLGELRGQLEAIPPAKRGPDFEAASEAVATELQNAKTAFGPDAVANVAEQVLQVARQVSGVVAPSDTLRLQLEALEGAVTSSFDATLDRRRSSLGGLGSAKGLTWITVAACGVVGVVATYIGGYLEVDAFGSVPNWAVLVGLAFGSSALARISAVMTFWDRTASPPAQ